MILYGWKTFTSKKGRLRRVCPVCEYGIKLTKKNRDEILADVERY